MNVLTDNKLYTQKNLKKKLISCFKYLAKLLLNLKKTTNILKNMTININYNKNCLTKYHNQVITPTKKKKPFKSNRGGLQK